MKRLRTAFFAALFSVVFFTQPTAMADVSINPEFEGLLIVTTPEGDLLIVDRGDPMPEILSGSLVEVFDGQFEVSVNPGDLIEVTCLEHDATLAGPGSLRLRCVEETGLLEVLAGNVTLVTPEGEVITLEEGEEYEIHFDISLLLAPPTAAGEATGMTFEDPSPEVDPTGIDFEEQPASPIL